MLDLTKVKNYYVVAGYTDMRKGIEGLAFDLLQQGFNIREGLSRENLFLFCGRRADRYKMMYWDGRTLNVVNRRLPEGRFRWPRSPKGLRLMDARGFLDLVEAPAKEGEAEVYEVYPYELF